MTVSPFHFFPASGETVTFDLGDIEMTGRISRSGRRVMLFPAPFEDLEIVEGERVGPAKMARIRHAIAELTKGRE